MNLIASKYLKTSDEIGNDMNKYNFGCVNIRKVCKAQRTSIFQIINAYVTKSNIVKDSFEVQVTSINFNVIE